MNGLVFLLLGTQLPEIIQTVWNNPDIGNIQVILYTLLLTAAVLGLRLVWMLVMDIPEGEEPRGPWKLEFRKALILTLSGGPRYDYSGEYDVTAVFFLDDGSYFPARDLIIFLAAGVILWTLLASNFLLPLLLGSDHEAEHNAEEVEAKN
ncbi:hypothetical protein ACFSQ7_36590 [Paenibacillus rhizoplanae]